MCPLAVTRLTLHLTLNTVPKFRDVVVISFDLWVRRLGTYQEQETQAVLQVGGPDNAEVML